ncbi:MAG: thiamine pyrophosphate-dependent enzyme, partial [Gammaproteobacteria bacterium]|nr:thiamine pyrophosphate-dependent enzyme [Gammaproteobacteria bacterium]
APARMGRRAAVDAPLRGHAKPTIEAMLDRVEQKRTADFYRAMLEAKRDWLDKKRKQESSDAVPIKPQRLIGEIAAAADDDAVFVCDTGTSTAWTARHLPVRPNQRYTLSSALASMAFAMPGAIGAKLSYPDRQVIAIAGDGGLAMLMGDFVTAVRYELPIICVVLNNRQLGFIALEQQAKGLPPHSIDLTNPDFAAFARACGGFGSSVEHPSEIRAAFAKAVASGQPAIIDVRVDPNELILPPRISLEQAANFGLSKLKAFLE